MFTRDNLRKRCSAEVQLVMDQFLSTTRCHTSSTDMNTQTSYYISTYTKLWHTDAGFISMIARMDRFSWGLLSLTERILMLMFTVFTGLQLHHYPPPADEVLEVRQGLERAAKLFAHCIQGMDPFCASYRGPTKQSADSLGHAKPNPLPQWTDQIYLGDDNLSAGGSASPSSTTVPEPSLPPVEVKSQKKAGKKKAKAGGDDIAAEPSDPQPPTTPPKKREKKDPGQPTRSSDRIGAHPKPVVPSRNTRPKRGRSESLAEIEETREEPLKKPKVSMAAAVPTASASGSLHADLDESLPETSRTTTRTRQATTKRPARGARAGRGK